MSTPDRRIPQSVKDALAEERWEVCPGFPRYCVSTEGRVRRTS